MHKCSLLLLRTHTPHVHPTHHTHLQYYHEDMPELINYVAFGAVVSAPKGDGAGTAQASF